MPIERAQQGPGVGDNPLKPLPPLLGAAPVDLGLLLAEAPLQPMALDQLLPGVRGLLQRRLQQLPRSLLQKLVGVLYGCRSENVRGINSLLLLWVYNAHLGCHLRQAVEHLPLQLMDDQPTPKVTQIRMRNLRKVHREPQRMLPAQVKLESINCLPITDIFVALKQQNPRHQRGRVRRAPVPVGIHLAEVLVPQKARAELVENPVYRIRLHLAGHLRRDVHQVPLILALAHHGPRLKAVKTAVLTTRRDEAA
jgi:hypothetical protein